MSEPDPEGAWSLVLHGGARAIDAADRPRFAEGCLQAARIGETILARGGSAVDAVEAVVRTLEDLPQFNAGTGSVRNAEGRVQMDAAIMDGSTLAVGGVGALEGFRHPVSIARAMLDATPTLLVGEGARRFAEATGAERAKPAQNDMSDQASAGCDTVGCVARDRHGHVAAAGSTGGLAGKMPGRVGDTPLPGCGLYADDALGAVALSGDGESISRGMLGARALFALADKEPGDAAEAAIGQLPRTGGEAGVILIDAAGRIGIAHNSPQFSIAIAAHWLDAPRAGTHVDDLKEWLS